MTRELLYNTLSASNSELYDIDKTIDELEILLANSTLRLSIDNVKYIFVYNREYGKEFSVYTTPRK